MKRSDLFRTLGVADAALLPWGKGRAASSAHQFTPTQLDGKMKRYKVLTAS